MYQSHFFNYCQHCGVNTAAIEQAVLPHASSTFLTLRIKAPALADSAALQTSSASQEKAFAAPQLLARLLEKAPLCQKYPQQPSPVAHRDTWPQDKREGRWAALTPYGSAVPTPHSSQH